MREYGKQKIVRIHFFPAGMLSCPFLIGAMLSNLCPVVVYEKERLGGLLRAPGGARATALTGTRALGKAGSRGGTRQAIV